MLHAIRRQLGSLSSAASSRLARATSYKPSATGLLSQAATAGTPAAWHQAALMRLLSIGRGSDKHADGLDLERSKPQQHASKQTARSAPAAISNVQPHSADGRDQFRRPRNAASVVGKSSWETRQAAQHELNGQLEQCLRSRNASRAMRLLQQYNVSGSTCKPDVFHYSKAINVIVACQRLDLAAEILPMMRVAGVEPNSHIYSGLMKCYTQGGLPEKASDMWTQLRSDGVRVEPSCYSAAITAYTKAGRLKDAKAVFHGMKQDGVVPLAPCYGAMMRAYAVEGQFAEVLMLVDTMKAKGLSLDAHCYGAIMKAYITAGKPEEALQLFYSPEVNRLRPDVVMYGTAIDACSYLKDLPQAKRLFQMMLDQRVKPNIITYNSMIDVCSSVGDWQAAEKYFDEMISKRIKPDVQTYSILIRVCGECGQCDKAKLWFEAISAAGLKHYMISYGMMINAYTRAQRYSEADEMYKRMLRMRVLTHWNPEKPGQIDLHEHSYGTALAAMRLVFNELCGVVISRGGYVHDLQNDMRIITGHAKKRALFDGSIVQQSVLQLLDQRGLQYSIDSVGGRVVISTAELQAYVARQQTTAAKDKCDTTH